MEQRTDLLVVGAGIAGLGAALAASRSGARVCLVDPDREAGGTARFAAGGMCIAGSPLQERLGLRDSPDLALRDWLAMGGEDVDVAWAQRYLDASVEAVFERLGRLGVTWGAVESYEGNRVPRFHRPVGGGAEVVRRLVEAVETEGRVTWRLGTRATGLLQEAGTVVGAIVSGPAGAEEIRASATLLATGGFCGSRSLVEEHIRLPVPVLAAGGPGAVGDGLGLLRSVDAQFADLSTFWTYPFTTPSPWDAGERGLVLRGIEQDVWVDDSGQRFHDEAARGGLSGTRGLLRVGGSCWSVFDARSIATFEISDPRFRNGGPRGEEALRVLAERSADVHVVHDLDQLPTDLPLEVNELRRTLDRHNGHRRSLGCDVDPDFGRPLAGLEPIDRPPFVVARLQLAARKNLGGVVTDLRTQVLDQDGRPVPGLLAAGEVAGMAGGHVNGRGALEGTMAGPSFYSGWVAGSEASA